jgi:FKBP-type peptidyl-prolyl cis-trans isomerase
MGLVIAVVNVVLSKIGDEAEVAFERTGKSACATQIGLLSKLMTQCTFDVGFGDGARTCENTKMLKTLGVAAMGRTVAVCAGAMVAGMMLCMSAMAQQSSTTNTQQAPAAKTQKPATEASAGTGSAAKSGTGGLVTKKDKQSYAIGMNVGRSLKQQPIELDPNIVAQGLKDTLIGGKMALTDDEAHAVLAELQGELQKKQEAMMQQMGSANKKEGDAFLAANKAKEGVVTLPSGLQYKILTKGSGPKPTTSDTVVCNYRGTLINGKEFDSSYKRGQPASFPVGGVIKGWTEALQLMPAGSKWQLFVPAEMAYGDRGAGPDIGPGSTLIFEVELISIQGKK